MSLLWTYKPALIPARLEGREKRFLSYATLEDGTKVTAHCPNPGRMTSCLTLGNQIWLTYNPDPKRKLKYTWELSEQEQSLVIVNTQMANKLVRAMLDSQLIPELKFDSVRPEFKVGPSRFDFLLTAQNGDKTLIEVKQVTLAKNDTARFPDAVTKRGAKHLKELAELHQEGSYRCVQLYLIARDDVHQVGFAQDVDPEYYQEACKAKNAGVVFLAYGVSATSKAVNFRGKLPLTWD